MALLVQIVSFYFKCFKSEVNWLINLLNNKRVDDCFCATVELLTKNC